MLLNTSQNDENTFPNLNFQFFYIFFCFHCSNHFEVCSSLLLSAFTWCNRHRSPPELLDHPGLKLCSLQTEAPIVIPLPHGLPNLSCRVYMFISPLLFLCRERPSL